MGKYSDRDYRNAQKAFINKGKEAFNYYKGMIPKKKQPGNDGGSDGSSP